MAQIDLQPQQAGCATPLTSAAPIRIAITALALSTVCCTVSWSESEVNARVQPQTVEQARTQRLLSGEHFSVDGTLLEAWASVKSFRPKDEDPPPPSESGGRNPEVDFRGERRSNETHQFTTDPGARLARKGKGKEAKLCFGANVLMDNRLMDNREGPVVDVRLTPAAGTWERDAALEMLEAVPGARRITVGADRGYDTRDFVKRCRKSKVTPHVAQKQRSTIDRRTTHHEGYRLSQRVRKRIEEVFGWVKTVAGGRKLRYCGVERNPFWMEMTTASYKLMRLAKLTA